MPQKWLQVRGDPSVRAFQFAQERIESQFDGHLCESEGQVLSRDCVKWLE
jgi:hypothetical protein